MADQTSKLFLTHAAQSVRRELYEIDVNLGKALAREDSAQTSCPFAQLYLASLFALELTVSTPSLRDPSLLVGTDQMVEENSWGRDLPLLFAAGRGQLS